MFYSMQNFKIFPLSSGTIMMTRLVTTKKVNFHQIIFHKTLKPNLNLVLYQIQLFMWLISIVDCHISSLTQYG